MPKGIPIEDNNLLERFKVAVQQKICFNVTLHRNYSLLSELIYEKTNCKISTSTIKRIFSNTHQTSPSKYSLDCIARAIGFLGWDDFVTKDLEFSEFEYHYIIQYLKNNGYNNADDFQSIFYRFLETPYCFKVSSALIEEAIQTNDVEVLSTIFDLPKIWELNSDDQLGMFFHKEVGMLFRNSTVINKLIKVYAKHPVAQTSYIELEVDEERLNGYYGALLEEYTKHKTNTEAQLFYHCLMCQRDFENGDYNSAHFNYLLFFKTEEKIHPITGARRLALIIVKNIDNPELVDSLLDEIPDLLNIVGEEHTYFSIYKFCDLVFQTRNPYPIKTALSYLPLTTHYPSCNYNANSCLNMLKIYESFVLLKEGEPQKAKEKLETYNRIYCFPYFLEKIKIHYNIVNRMIMDNVQ